MRCRCVPGDRLGGGSRSVADRSGSTASWSAAAHPSVRPTSASTRARVGFDPASARNAGASSSVKRRSSARTSTRAPWARSRPSGRAGSSRADEHEVAERRHALDEPTEQLHRVRPVGRVEVVEHDDDVVVVGRDGVEHEVGEGAGVRRGAGRDRLRKCRGARSDSGERRSTSRVSRAGSPAWRRGRPRPPGRPGRRPIPPRRPTCRSRAARTRESDAWRDRTRRPGVRRVVADGGEPRDPGPDPLAPGLASEAAQSSPRVWRLAGPTDRRPRYFRTGAGRRDGIVTASALLPTRARWQAPLRWPARRRSPVG